MDAITQSDRSRYLLFWDLAIPLALLLFFAPVSSTIDLYLANYFYDPISRQFSTHPFFVFFYRWGVKPGQVFGVTAFFVFLFSFYHPKLLQWRKPALQIGLTLAIGAGFITHTLLKESWKRPRPKQLEQFGGTESFTPFYQPNFSKVGKFKSFSSGHASMGFCFFSLALIGRSRKNRAFFISGMLLALILGGCLSLSRIAQGGHFFSDTLFAACLMWMTAAICERVLKNRL